jgi:hypothetical protein
MPQASMTSRERLWAALSHQEPDRVPIWMLYPREGSSSYADVDHLSSYASVMPLIREHTDWLDLPHPPLYSAAAHIETHTTQRGRYTVQRHVLHTPYGDLTMERWRDGQNELGAVVKYFVETIERLEPDEMEHLVRRQFRDAAMGGGMILAPTAGPYAAELTARQQANTRRMIEAGLRWGRYPLAAEL